MLVSQICRELHFGPVERKPQSRIPRCLFGPPNPKETIELLQEALEAERTRFAKRWGVDPLTEEYDKENTAVQRVTNRAGGCNTVFIIRVSPSKRRVSPYSKQTNIHDYWRSRKVCDTTKKSSSSAFVEVSNQQQPQPQPQPQAQTQEQPPPESPTEPQNDAENTPSSPN